MTNDTNTVAEDQVNNSTEQATEETEATVEEVNVSEREAELLNQLEEAQAKVLRVQADYDNFRRRTQKEKEELAKYASAKLIENILPVVDNFERAIAASAGTNDYESLSKGVDMIFRQFMQSLQNEGLVVMNPVGEPFNPEFHQAIMNVETDEYEEGIVVEEVQKGYLLKDKVLRPAMVKVSG